MSWVCLSVGLIAFHFHLTAVLFVFWSLFLSRLEDLIKKLALVLCALSRGVAQRSLIIKIPLLFYFLTLYRREKKMPHSPPDCRYSTLSMSSDFQQHGTVVTALSLIYLSSIQLQPVTLSRCKHNFSLLTGIIFGTFKILCL